MPESASGGGGGVCSGGGGCLPLSALGGSVPRGCLLRGVSAHGGVLSQHAPRQTPPLVNRMTKRCKNITLATTSLRPVTIKIDKGIHMSTQNLGYNSCFYLEPFYTVPDYI